MIVGLILGLVSCSSENYGIAFELGASDKEIIETLDKRFIDGYDCEYYEEYDVKEIYIRRNSFNGIECNRSRIFLYNDKVCFMEHTIHGIDNINALMKYLETTYGEPNAKNENPKDEYAKYYWGNKNSKFLIIRNCDSHKRVYIGDMSNENELTAYYKQKIFNE